MLKKPFKLLFCIFSSIHYSLDTLLIKNHQISPNLSEAIIKLSGEGSVLRIFVYHVALFGGRGGVPLRVHCFWGDTLRLLICFLVVT